MAGYLREPALFVGNIDDDMDFSVPPSSGEEYLKRVVLEAQQCDDVVVANIDRSKFKKPTGITPLEGCVEAPSHFRPTVEWQNYQVADFSEVRMKMEGLKFERAESTDWKNNLPTLPPANSSTEWIDFCLGASNQETEAHQPSLSIILSMNQSMVEQVLEYLVDEVENKGTLTPQMGRWIYALLTIIEMPLDPDVCACLRTLARACSKLRASLTSEDDTQVSTMNLFICLVARYFKQLDLADT
ncbi:gem-associated protein 2 [Chelonus insularis]|uniref:gem-associated protein 2 n=1 Tax=Chelonus insularis TaxID=460826 RepID=UPI00158B3D7F|nr:gem-associated protein 2 [Chelonus insularis]